MVAGIVAGSYLRYNEHRISCGEEDMARSKRGRQIYGIPIAGLVVMAFLALTPRPASTAPAAGDVPTPVVWFPLAWYGASPWMPTATPTLTSTPTHTATPTQTPTITPTPAPAISIRDLIYTGTDEYVEIYNAGPGTQALYGWKIHSIIGDQWYEFPWGIALDAGDWLRVHSGPGAYEDPPTHLKWSGGYIWNNSGDEAELIDGLGRIVDRWSY